MRPMYMCLLFVRTWLHSVVSYLACVLASDTSGHGFVRFRSFFRSLFPVAPQARAERTLVREGPLGGRRRPEFFALFPIKIEDIVFFPLFAPKL